MAASTGRKARNRKRLVESKTEEALKKRGTEALGFLLILIGVAFLALMWTYNPLDPSFTSATSASATNALGIFGSYIADPLHRAIGWAGFGVGLSFVGWGLRFMTHTGHTRALRRAVFSPLAIAVFAVFLAAHVPPSGWIFEYGLGGIFGDIVLGWLLPLIPGGIIIALISATVGLGVIALVFSGYVIGMTWAEVRTTTRVLWHGFITAYLGLRWTTVRLLRLAGSILAFLGLKSVHAAKKAHEIQKTRRAEVRVKREQAAENETRRLQDRHDDGEILDGDDANDDVSIGSASMPRLGGVRRDDTVLEDSYDDAPSPARKPMVLSRPEPRVQRPIPKVLTKSARAKAEEQPRLALEPGEAGYERPPLTLLENPSTIVRQTLSDDALNENARMLENVLDDYGVKGEIVSVRPGPVVTMYELEPAAGLKASRVIGLADDIARSMSALAARVSTIPGRSVIGIELPNDYREKVLFREIISSSAYGDSKHQLPLALGKDIGGEPIVANLARMPHLLIAGTTGSGKSVAINTMILSLLYSLSPEECRMIMVDPKMLELSVYDGIPHLLSPVVTDPKKAVVALKWVVAEMEERYRKMSKMGVRNIDGYNGRVKEALAKGEDFQRTVQTGFDDDTGEPVFETETFTPETMPYIVVIVDEMADLMMVAGKEIEACIQRLAQMARASGIHLIMATQRPSVDVITGTIKANFPTRISFQVTSKIDSRTILGEMGAEQLLGMGDMLYMAGGGRVTRVHGPFVSDEEVEEIVNFLKAQGEPVYISGVVEGPESDEEANIDLVLGLGGNTGSEDALYDQAVAIVARDRKCSTSYIQRKLAIGYNKAARLVEQMEENSVVSSANHVGKRDILIPEA